MRIALTPSDFVVPTSHIPLYCNTPKPSFKRVLSFLLTSNLLQPRLPLPGVCDCYTGRQTVCCVLWAPLWVSQKVVLSFLASPSDKKRSVFHLQVPKKGELLRWQSGQEFHFTVKKIVEWKYWMQLSVSYLAPRSPLNSSAISNNKVNTSLDRNPTAVKNKHDQLSFSSFPLPLPYLSALSLSFSLSFSNPKPIMCN